MKIVLMTNIYDRIVSIRNCTNVFLPRKPGRKKRPGFFIPAVQNKGVYMMKFLLAMIIIRFLFSLLDNKPHEYEEDEATDNGRIIHPAEYLLR